MKTSNPAIEQARLTSLKTLNILDTLPEQEFDDLTLLASQICETPIALISLVDNERQWFKSRVGISATATPREYAFCAHAIQGDDVFMVQDASKDSRFADNPLVRKDPHIRFYAGAPLVAADGCKLGTLCVIDRKPRQLSAEQMRALNALARSVMNLIETRKELQEQRKAKSGLASLKNSPVKNERPGNFWKNPEAGKSFFAKYVQHYLIATILVIICAFLKVAFDPIIKTEAPFLFFFCAVLLSAWRGGFGPGLYSTILSAFIADYYFLAPNTLFFDQTMSQNVRLFIFAIQGLLISGLCGSRLRSELLLLRSSEELETRVENRTSELEEANTHLQQEIHERNLLEEDLFQARDSAIESGRLKSEFLANMSHEIRTPMNGVIGMTGLLLDTRLSDEQKRYAQIIQNSGESLLTIINDILDFSKIEANKLEFETLSFNLRDVVEGTVELFMDRARAQNDELTALIYSDVALELRGDPSRLRQILTNLVSNAIKFTENGEVIVRVKKAQETASHICLYFSVSDTGHGISDDAKARLFQPFTQSDASTTRRFGGTGLGLAISKKLVEMMDGDIGLESSQGKGSTFWFTVLLEKQQNVSAVDIKDPIREPAPSNLSNRRVLVVDDNQVNREVLTYQANSWAMSVDEAQSGQEALDKLWQAAIENNPFELVIMDLQMPDMDGLETAYQIKAQANNKLADFFHQPAIVMISSSSQKIDSETISQLGIRKYLSKPYRQNDLFNAVCDSFGVDINYLNGELTQDSSIMIHESQITSPINKQSKRILLVEDNQINQLVAKTQLKKFGYNTDVAANGLEALEALANIPYNLILMDCQMPEMDGYEATKAIRAKGGKFTRLPIIAMTAHAIEGEREKCLFAGMSDYISKPVDPQKLDMMLEKWLLEEEMNHADDILAEESAKMSEEPADVDDPTPDAKDDAYLDSTPDSDSAANLDLNSDIYLSPAEEIDENYQEISEETESFSDTKEFLLIANAVDLTMLDEISGDSPEMRRDIIEMYLEQTARQLDEIEQAINNEDAITLYNSAHKALGSSATCGMTAIVTSLKNLEKIGRSGETKPAVPMLGQARQAFGQITYQCREILKD